MKAITTKYKGATETKSACIVATEPDGKRFVYHHNMASYEDIETAHANAAIGLCKQLGWYGELIPGETKDGYVFVFKNDDRRLYRVPKHNTYETMDDVIAANRAINHHWFDRDTMRFFGTRIESRLIAGKRFITSEKPPSGRRRYTIREAMPDGTIDTVGEFCQFATLRQAKAHVLMNRPEDTSHAA